MIPGITEVNFPGYATLDNAVVTLAEMGDRIITTTLRVDGDQVPEYGVWDNGEFLPMELRFRGEPYILPVREPQASKDNTSRKSQSGLTFYSWAVYQMKRYYFFQTTTLATGIVMADKYKASVSLAVGPFCDLLNSIFEYYLGENKIVVDVCEGTTSEIATVEISYSYIWDIMQKFYDVYGIRWYLEYDSEDDIFYIRVGYPPKEIDDHDFEYGFDGGLLRFERQVQDIDVNNILLGRGGTQNLPYRYFKKTDPQNPEWAADPDAIPELANIFFERILDANFRWYIRGWVKNTNRDTSHDEGYTLPDYDESDVPLEYLWSYNKGRYTDTVFNPVEFVRDAESIAKYGERWGALDDNDDIFPTIQGVMWGGTRIDTVIDVSPILSDDTSQAAEIAADIVNVDGVMTQTDMIPGSSTVVRVISGGTFVVPEGKTANLLNNGFFVSANVPRQQALNIVKTDDCQVLVYDATDDTPVGTGAIPEGTYRYDLRVVIQNTNNFAVDSVTYGVNGLYLQISSVVGEEWKPTFDIWVRNIFDTHREDGETDDEYSLRVWRSILGDKLGKEAKIIFSDGPMSISEDYEFKIASYPAFDQSKTYIDGTEAVTSEWRITLWKCDAELDATGLYIPAASGAKPVAGNHIFFVGIDMPNMYVTWAEEALSRYKRSALADLAEINPTWIVQLDKVRIDEPYNEYQERLIDKMDTGTKISAKDTRFTGGRTLSLFLQSVTFTWSSDTVVLPNVEVVLTDRISPVQSPVAQLQGQIDIVKATYAKSGNVEEVARAATRPLFLAKTGEEQTSESPTKFASILSSKDFRQGGFGGQGWGFFRDTTEMFDTADTAADDNPSADPEDREEEDAAHEETAARSGSQSVLEVDRLVVRHDMMVNNLVVNQIAYIGGKQIISAAAIECVQVIEDSDGYRCYFDQKQGSVKNLFMVNDVALGQVFTPENTELRFYKRLVTEVGLDYIKLSKTQKYGNGIPKKGDVIVQYGNTQYEDRRYVIIRDVIGGGYEQMLSDLDNVNASGVEYYFAGMNAGVQGDTLALRDSLENQLRDRNEVDLHVLGGSKPRFFVGNQDSYIEFLASQKEFTLHGTVVQSPSGVRFPTPCFRDEYLPNEWYYYGDMVTHLGQSWIHIGKDRTKGTEPVNGNIWALYAAKGSSIYRLDLTNENASINTNSDGTIPAESVRPTCTAIMYYGDTVVQGAVYSLSTPVGQTVAGLSINSATGVLTFNAGDAATPFSFSGNMLEITIAAVKGTITLRSIMTVTKNRPGVNGEDAVSYWLVLDADKVGVNPNTTPVTVSPTTVTPTAMLQVGTQAPREAVAEDALSITYNYDSETEAALPDSGYVTIAIENPTTQARRRTLHFFLKKTIDNVDTVVDQESVPILYDGTDGKSSVRADLSNEIDGVITNSAGAVQTARTVSTTIRVYDGATQATGVTMLSSASSLAIGGCTPFIGSSDGAFTINWQFTTSHTVPSVTTKTIQVSYGGKTYSADFTLQPSMGQAIYQLSPSLSSVNFSRQNDGTLSPASRTLDMLVSKIDGTGSASQTISQSGQTVRYSVSAMPSAATGGTAWGTTDGTAGITWSSGSMVIASNVAVSTIFVAMFSPSGVLLDMESIPIVKDGANGQAGASGKSTRGPSEWNQTRGFNNTGEYLGEDEPSGWSGGTGFIDIVMVLQDGEPSYYWCLKSHIASSQISLPSSGSNEYWSKMSNYDLIAARAIYAESLSAKKLTVDNLNTGLFSGEPRNRVLIGGNTIVVEDNASTPKHVIKISSDNIVGDAGSSGTISENGSYEGDSSLGDILLSAEVFSGLTISSNENTVSISGFTCEMECYDAGDSSVVIDDNVYINAYLENEDSGETIVLGVFSAYCHNFARLDVQPMFIPGMSVARTDGWRLVVEFSLDTQVNTRKLHCTVSAVSVTGSYRTPAADRTYLGGDGFLTQWGSYGFKATHNGAKVIQNGATLEALGGGSLNGLVAPKKVIACTTIPSGADAEDGVLYIKVQAQQS